MGPLVLQRFQSAQEEFTPSMLQWLASSVVYKQEETLADVATLLFHIFVT